MPSAALVDIVAVVQTTVAQGLFQGEPQQGRIDHQLHHLDGVAAICFGESLFFSGGADKIRPASA